MWTSWIGSTSFLLNKIVVTCVTVWAQHNCYFPLPQNSVPLQSLSWCFRPLSQTSTLKIEPLKPSLNWRKLVGSDGRASALGSRVQFLASALPVLTLGKIIHLHLLTLPRCKWKPVLLVKFLATDWRSVLGWREPPVCLMSWKLEIGSNLMAQERQTSLSSA